MAKFKIISETDYGYTETLSVVDTKVEAELEVKDCYAKWGSSCEYYYCLLYTSPSPRDRQKSRMPSSA